jgi:hypothetical protein
MGGVKVYRRIGKVIPFRPSVSVPDRYVRIHSEERAQRMSEWYRMLSSLIYDRLSALSDAEVPEILAELQAQAVVLGAIARRSRDSLPGDQSWVDPAADWYADWLEHTRRM